LRERNILKQIPTSRIVENYLYGQIHFNELDDDEDRFTTAREGIVANDPKYKQLLDILKKLIINRVIEDWDIWRVKHRVDGDSENIRITKKERKSRELFNVVAEEYTAPPGEAGITPQDETDYRERVKNWVNELGEDAQFNFSSYAECFISENLVRKLIIENNINISDVQDHIAKLKNTETQNKAAGNINIELRQANIDISYLDMNSLAGLVDTRSQVNCLHNDSKQYKPIRDALMHTARLTEEAKRKLTTVYENIKGRIKTLLSGN